jgi:iron complex transport system substrate-binding protein
MDDKIDQEDVTYVNRIISGTVNNTQFADANKDGAVNINDVNQINALINGQATQIYLLDGNGKNINVTLPANRIIVEYIQNAELVRILEIDNKVVGFDYAVDKLRSTIFPGRSDIVSVGNMNSPDYEAVLSLNPDILLTFSNTATAVAEKTSKLPGVDVVFLGLYYPNVTAPEDSQFLQGILKAGYIFNKVPRATEYANWLVNLTSTINARTSTLTANQKQSVLIYTYPYTVSTTIKEYATIDTLGQVCILAGGANVAANLPTYLTASSISVDMETVLMQDPKYIFLHCVRYTFGGGTNADPAQGIDVNDITSIKTCLQQYLAQPTFANLTAVKNNHVYILAGDFRNNAMGGVLGAVYMANVLYPSLFTDLNPQTIHQQYITQYLRLSYNLDTSGVFLYPSITVNGDTVGIPNGAT